jgi:hypothetical protein
VDLLARGTSHTSDISTKNLWGKVDSTELRLEVLGSSDPLRKERLSRSLRDELAGIDGLSVAFARSSTPAPGSKGVSDSSDVLLLTGMLAPLAFDLVKTAISAWLQCDRRASLRVARGDLSVELNTNSDRGTFTALDKLLRLLETDAEDGER